jgi:hypothetical protein
VKKDGEWIATFGPSMAVSKVNVEASPALGLVEVTTIGVREQLTNIFYFDQVEAVRLLDAVRDAVDELERYEAQAQIAHELGLPEEEPPRFRLAQITASATFGVSAGYGIWDTLGETVLANRWPLNPGGRKQAETYLGHRNAGEATTDHPRPPISEA